MRYRVIIPDCETTQMMLSQALDSPLPFSQRWRVKLHLSMCPACSKFAQQLAYMRNAMQMLSHGDGD